MRRALPVAVVLVCLAGCGGVLGGDARSPATSTPAAVPTDDPLADPPEGLSADGVDDPFALSETHGDALDGRSFTVETTERLTAANGTELAASDGTERVSANHSRAVSTRTLTGVTTTTEGYAQMFDRPVTRVDNWYDGERLTVRVTGPNGTAYHSLLPTGTPGQQPSGTLRSYYLTADSETVSSENGTVEVHLDGVAGEWGVAGVAVAVTDATVTIVMTDTGFVERYRVEATGHVLGDADRHVEGVTDTRFSAVGETTVERPDWVADARAVSSGNRT